MPDWEFLAPMVGVTAWVAEQPFAAPLFPGTPHEWLCVHLQTGYNPDLPFFSCGRGATGSLSTSCGRRSAAAEVAVWSRSTKPATSLRSSLPCCME